MCALITHKASPIQAEQQGEGQASRHNIFNTSCGYQVPRPKMASRFSVGQTLCIYGSDRSCVRAPSVGLVIVVPHCFIIEMSQYLQVCAGIRSTWHWVQCLVDPVVCFTVDGERIELAHFWREVAGRNNCFSLPQISVDG